MKKIICTLLTTLLILSLLVTPVSATSQSNTQDAVLHFDANSAIKHWQPFSKVYCHIWEYDGEAFYPWHSDKSICTDSDNDGIYTYNLTKNGINLKENTQYCCLFSTNAGNHQYPLLFDTSVLGDTAYLTGDYYSSPEGCDEYYMFWNNKDHREHGPELVINPIGQVLGTCMPKGKTPISLLQNALINSIENARIFSCKSDQKIINQIAYQLGLSCEQVQNTIENSGVKVEWQKELSTADKLVGDADNDGEISILDATAIGLHLASLDELSEEEQLLSDIDFDSKVSILDATKIQRKLADYIFY